MKNYDIHSDTKPLISIITITYNAEKEVVPTMQSIAEQSFRDFEHILIDGASSDHTLEAVRNISRDTIILSQRDNGLYDAMNKGLHMAKGRYLLFLNAGDTFHDADTLKAYSDAIRDFHIRALGKNKSEIFKSHNSDHIDNTPSLWPDIIYGDTVIVDKDRKLIGPRHLSVPEELTFESFAQGMLVCHQAFMCRRAIAPDYNLNYRYSADYEWTLRCLQNSKPYKNINLKRVTIDYLTDGMTDMHHRASLKERFHIMSEYYGRIPTIFRHIGFLWRSLHR